MNAHLQTVQSIYQAFGAGHVPAILAQLADDVRWDADWADPFGQHAGAPLLAPRRGPDQVMAFFQALGGVQFHEFQVLDLVAGERQVVAEIAVEFTVNATGRRLRDEELHLWTFDAAGKVQRFRHYVDTAKHLWAFGLPLPQR